MCQEATILSTSSSPSAASVSASTSAATGSVLRRVRSRPRSMITRRSMGEQPAPQGPERRVETRLATAMARKNVSPHRFLGQSGVAQTAAGEPAERAKPCSCARRCLQPGRVRRLDRIRGVMRDRGGQPSQPLARHGRLHTGRACIVTLVSQITGLNYARVCNVIGNGGGALAIREERQGTTARARQRRSPGPRRHPRRGRPPRGRGAPGTPGTTPRSSRPRRPSCSRRATPVSPSTAWRPPPASAGPPSTAGGPPSPSWSSRRWRTGRAWSSRCRTRDRSAATSWRCSATRSRR